MRPSGAAKGRQRAPLSRLGSMMAARSRTAETNRGNAHEHQGVSGRRGRFRGHRARAPARASPRLPAGFGHLRRVGRHAGRAGVPRFRRRDRPGFPSARRVRLRRLRRGLSGSAAHGVARPDARARRPRHKRDRPLGRLPAQGSCRLRGMVQDAPHRTWPARAGGVRAARAGGRRACARRRRPRGGQGRGRGLRRLLSHGHLACRRSRPSRRPGGRKRHRGGRRGFRCYRGGEEGHRADALLLCRRKP